MKKLILSVALIGFAALANAQKTEVAEAKKKWSLFELAGANLPFNKKIDALNVGLAHTDNATKNEKTKDLPESWAYRSLFASAIALTDTVNVSNSFEKQKIAEEAIAKTKVLDVKKTVTESITNAETNLRNAFLVRGAVAYGRKNFELALASFEQLTLLNPQDTSMHLNAGVTAKILKKYPEAIKHFKNVIKLNSPMSKDLFSEMIAITLSDMKDTTATLGLLEEAIAKFPNEANFVGIQTDIYIAQGNIQKTQESLKKLIEKEPSKPVYHYLLGDTYYKQALSIQELRTKLEKDRAALRKKADPKKLKEFDIQTNKEEDVLIAKMTVFIDQSIPFYKKSLELDSKFIPALESLKQIYGFKSDQANFEDMKKRLEAISKN
jgi:tetratricopeptide (TPR) repeat protein